MEPVTHQQKNEAIAGFPFEGILVSENPYGSGHINDTFLLVLDLGDDEEVKVILQRMNKDVFCRSGSSDGKYCRRYLLFKKEDRGKRRRSGQRDPERDPCGRRQILL